MAAKKDQRVEVRLTAGEMAVLRKAAAGEGLTVSALVRGAVAAAYLQGKARNIDAGHQDERR